MAQLYAACREEDQLITKNIQITDPIKLEMETIFSIQRDEFLHGINDIIDFTGEWKPDSDELLVIRNLPEVNSIIHSSSQNPVSLPDIDPRNFQFSSIKALFIPIHGENGREILIQSFSPQQILKTRSTFLYDGIVFRKLSAPAFTLGGNIVAIINESGEIHFKSYALLRRIFDVTPIFRQATDHELNAFCQDQHFHVPDTLRFIALADEGIRKYVVAIDRAEVLARHSIDDLANRANSIGFPVLLENGRISIPSDRRSVKALLSFLLNKVYRGPIDEKLQITNSNRPLM